MFKELKENEIEDIKEVQKITLTDYELKGNFIPVENYMSIIQDLLCEYHKLEEQVEDLKEYKNQHTEEDFGVSDSWFH